MPGKIDIINMAMTRIAMPRIVSFEDPTPQARLAAQEFDSARDCVLRDFRWGFAARTSSLPPLAEKPSGGRNYAYAYPPDCLLARRVAAGGSDVPYEIADMTGKTVILCDANPMTFHYTARIENSERFDPLFADALAWRLAVVFATGAAADMQKAQMAQAMYDIAISRARTADATEEGRDVSRISSYEAGRY